MHCSDLYFGAYKNKIRIRTEYTIALDKSRFNEAHPFRTPGAHVNIETFYIVMYISITNTNPP